MSLQHEINALLHDKLIQINEDFYYNRDKYPPCTGKGYYLIQFESLEQLRGNGIDGLKTEFISQKSDSIKMDVKNFYRNNDREVSCVLQLFHDSKTFRAHSCICKQPVEYEYDIPETCTVEDVLTRAAFDMDRRVGYNRFCLSCRKAGKVFRCAACNMAHYCSKECQKAHWEEHKSDCKKYKNIVSRRI